MAFKFNKSQCVNVPGQPGVQGRVAVRTDYVGQPNTYLVAWLDPKLTRVTEIFDEKLMLEANAPVPVFVAEPAKPAKRKGKR